MLGGGIAVQAALFAFALGVQGHRRMADK